MKILKYIFLLILLAFIGVTVFVATQKSNFYTKQSTLIKVPRSIVFNYMNDYRNWEEWYLKKQNQSGFEFSYSDVSVGQGAYISWSGSGNEGKIQSFLVKGNDSIVQKVSSNGNEYDSSIIFKDSLGGTKVTWICKGSVDFMGKVNATLSGGVNKLMNIFFENSLAVLNKTISKEINDFSANVNGVVEIPATFYIKKTYKCKTPDLNAAIHTVVPKLISFFKKNKITMNGKPFLIFDKKSTDSITFTICGPLREEIFVSPGSDITVGSLQAFSALKTTLKGDYSHREQARKVSMDYVRKNRIELINGQKEMEIYKIGNTEIKNPSQWVTELLIPAYPIVVAPKPELDSQIIDSLELQ